MKTFLNGNIILGDEYAKYIRNIVALDVIKLRERNIIPCLVVVLVGNDPASKIYVSNKKKFAEDAGMKSIEIILPEGTSEAELLNKVEELNQNDSVHGILVQMPVPKHINANNIINSINPKKDVDGFHPVNMGRLLTNTLHEKSLMPCTPLGCMYILETLVDSFRGKHAVIIGSSNIVGKPMAAMLINKGATVSVLNSSTKDRKLFTKNADILITACGVPNLIHGDDISNPIILDVGINRLENGKIAGDCNFTSCQMKAKYITPVPKGIGPMTIAMLLRNTVLTI